MYFPILGLIETHYNHIKKHEFIGGWEEDNDVYLWYRDENGERKTVMIPDVPRYFCITRQQFQTLDKKDLAFWKEHKFYTTGQVIGDYAYFYSKERIYRSVLDDWLCQLEDNYHVKPLEADVNRVQRLMVDLDLKVATPEKVKVGAFDIETDDRGNKPRPGEDRILSVVFRDLASGEETFLVCDEDTDESEFVFLEQVYDKALEFDLLFGFYNYGFDDECLLGRFAKYGFDLFKWRRLKTLDMYNLFERQGTFKKYDVRNHKLDTIAKAVLGRGKVEHKEKIYDLWANNRALLEEYNKEDVRLICEMEKKLGTVNLILSVCSEAGLLHGLGYSPAKTIDTFLLRRAARNRQAGVDDFRYPTAYYRPEHKSDGGKFSAFTRNALSADKRKGRKERLEELGIEFDEVEGAYVLDIEPGFYHNVYFADFNSLYPSLIICFNIGHDTLVNEDFTGPKAKAANGVYYRTDRISGMSASVEFLLEERKKVKKLMNAETDPVLKNALFVRQNAIKELTNSAYGITAQYGGRHYNKAIAESITAGGRLFLNYGKEFLAKRGHKAVLGDTDSLAMSLTEGSDAETVKDEFVNEIRNLVKTEYNAFRPEILKMSVERKAEYLLIVAKKLYALLETVKDGKPCEPELIVKGLGIKKGNNPRFATRIGEKVLRDIFENKHTADYFARYLENERDKLENGDVPVEELIISARLGRDLDQYVSGREPLPHVKVARQLQERGVLINSYMTLSYIISNGDDGLEPVPEELIVRGETKYDAAYYWNNFVMAQAGEYLELVFPELNWKSLRFPKRLKRTGYFECKVTIK